MKGLLAWNGAAVAGGLVVWALHEHFGPRSMVLAQPTAEGGKGELSVTITKRRVEA